MCVFMCMRGRYVAAAQDQALVMQLVEGVKIIVAEERRQRAKAAEVGRG